MSIDLTFLYRKQTKIKDINIPASKLKRTIDKQVEECLEHFENYTGG